MNKKVLITGGGSGIGRAIAEGFAELGSDIWVTDIDQLALNNCPSNWQKSQLDIADENAVSTLVQSVEKDWHQLDVLCSNAGIPGPTTPLEDISVEEWRRCLSVNLDGAFFLCKNTIPIMKRQRNGVILLTSSTAGLFGFTNRAPYVASKWGLHGLLKTLAIELGPFNIRVNALCPGSVEGTRLDLVLEREAAAKGVSLEEIRKAYRLSTSIPSSVTSSDVAAMAVFLASNGARRISGQTIAIDGNTEHPEPKFL